MKKRRIESRSGNENRFIEQALTENSNQQYTADEGKNHQQVIKSDACIRDGSFCRYGFKSEY